ncbi:MAG TPA: hypothetical protein VEZ11_00430 [Thermoanaerobaculia bacterium]|nr:hypothetical protein [Thermoanaerobaculia bacterium]
MPFLSILRNLLATTQGSIAAMFLDYEGETVELLTDHDLEKDDLRIVGAYQGIFLTRLRGLCNDISVGRPMRFKLEFEKTKVLICDLEDGYYVVLLVFSEASEGLAWHRLEHCRDALLKEM